jgi:general secretion pathway protein H
MAKPVVKATTLKWGLGSNVKSTRGFTLIELLLVVALIAVASGLATFALRNPASTQLENEAARLVALLESARAQSRGTGIAVKWLPRGTEASPQGFRFEGLLPGVEMPTQWLGSGVSAEIGAAPALVLGPEPLIGPQRIVLNLEDQRLVLTTDGLGPFEVSSAEEKLSP